MSELLLELLSEEIPARMQPKAAGDLASVIESNLKNARLDFSTLKTFVTPRRITINVHGLPYQQPDILVEKKGPRVGAPEEAINGFLKSSGVSINDCEQRETAKGLVWFSTKMDAGRKTSEILENLIPNALSQITWEKSMRWGGHKMRWVRPLHNILCVFDGETVSFNFEHLESGSETEGHRFMCPDTIKILDFNEYKYKLSAAKVMLCPVERQSTIIEQARLLSKEKGLILDEDTNLLKEIVGLNEWPVPLIGKFDKSFLEIPEEVLISAMRRHQKYFATRDSKGNLAPYFVVVANIETADSGSGIISGNERVLKARLSDARFFWELDLKVGLEKKITHLDSVVFQAQLGSVGDKVRRIKYSSKILCDFIEASDPNQAERAAHLCKADLLTEMVSEFPDLQGIMGSYYAREAGEDEIIVRALAEHYRPQGPSDFCPSNSISIVISLADKLDTLVGFFAINQKPTGSKDPFALRRSALGVIRLIVENKLRIPLTEVLSNITSSYGELPESVNRKEVVLSLLEFFAERLKVHLKARGIRHDLISAVFAIGNEDDLIRLLARVDALDSFLNTEDGANLLIAYRRATNILRIEESKEGNSYLAKAEAKFLNESAEKELMEHILLVSKRTDEALINENFTDAMLAMSALRNPVDRFFENVTVNTKDKNLRENRLKILASIRETMDKVAYFSLIEG